MNIQQTDKGRAAARGYSLVELVVGILLVTLVVSALYAGMTFTLQLSNQTREDLRATQIMVEKLDILRLYTWDQIGSPFDPDDPEDLLDPFDSEDPHTPGDEAEPFILPTTFSAPYTPGSTNADELIYFGSLTLTNAPVAEEYGPQLLLARVTVNWTNAVNGRAQSRSMQTLFAKYGMQNNIRR